MERTGTPVLTWNLVYNFNNNNEDILTEFALYFLFFMRIIMISLEVANMSSSDIKIVINWAYGISEYN